nr:type VII secretion protein EccCa [Jongsikchunia kroppenstedtii]
MPGGDVPVQAPPEVPRVIPPNVLARLMPVVMVVAVIGMVALMIATGGRQLLTNPLMLMFPMMMLMSMVGMFAGRAATGGKKAAELNEDRKDYLRYLTQTRAEVRETGTAQRAALEWSHPDPRALAGIVGGRRMWERRPADADFGHVRVGIGSHRLASRLLPPETAPLEDVEPVSAVAMRRFIRTHSVVHGLPTSISLRGFPAINVEGDPAATRRLARSMIVQLCAFHGPDQLRIAIVTDDPESPQWSWTKWLPHVADPARTDGIGAARMIFRSLAELESALGSDLNERGRFSRTAPPVAGRALLVVFIDDGHVGGDERLIADAGTESVVIVDLSAPSDGVAVRRGLQLVVADQSVGARSVYGVEEFATPDQVSAAEAEAFARAMARYRLATAATLINLEQDAAPVDPGLFSLLGVADPAQVDPERLWRKRSPRERLRVPVGYSASGSAIEIDLKESAEGGMGPHGLCIGATGSGKSEFLRTLVLSLATTHSSEALNLVLVDFKGGATFLGLDALPHVSAVITNLEDELVMVDRMRDALSGEMNRRQELLRSAGNYANVGDYERARAQGAPLAPLPALFIVVDEFSELLAQKPDFAELFVAIGRLGRSLHMHLLLASQRLEEGKLRGLDSHLSYRIGLKTFSANESRSVLGVPDAYHLPSVPGSAYLKCDSAEPVRFNTCYVSGPYRAPDSSDGTRAPGRSGAGRVKPFTASFVPVDPVDEPDADRAQPDSANEVQAAEVSVLATVVARLAGRGPAAHEVWLPPLDSSPTVRDLVGPHDAGTLQLPVAIVDRPYDQRRDRLVLDVSGAAGNIAIVGGPQSGKSSTVRTIIMAAAATHSPEQIQFFCLDFGGGALAGLAELPHVGSVATRNRPDVVRRTIAEVTGLIRDRERRFAELGIESMRHYRAYRAAMTGPAAERSDLFGDLFLVIDGLATIRGEFEGLEDQVNAIVSQGLSYGVHVVVTAARWAEIRPAIKDLLGTRLELRLGDALDSEINRRTAESVPRGRPGRGLTADQMHMLVALPRLDEDDDPTTVAAGLARSVEQVAAAYPGRQAPAVRTLAGDIPRAAVLDRLTPDALRPHGVAIGLDESDLAPVVLDFAGQPHLVILGDVEHGKTTLLRSIVAGLVENGSADDTRIILVDYRRTMLGAIDSDHLAGYATSAPTLAAMVAELRRFLQARLPGDDVTTEQLRERSWWSGPDVFVVVDDYDMVAVDRANPLSELVDLLPQARDIGLHLILARRSGGAGRAMFDPVIARLKDLSCDAFLMSGDRDEGYLFGRTRMQALPPGRGQLISRSRRTDMVQVTNLPPQ